MIDFGVKSHKIIIEWIFVLFKALDKVCKGRYS